MSEPMEKATVLAKMQGAYEQLNTLLAPLSEAQKTMPGVNGAWSVKDNLAHITAWQDLLPGRIQNWLAGQKPTDPVPGLQGDDEINEYFYQKYKDRSWDEVEAAFHSSYQRAFAAVEAVNEEAINAPIHRKPDGPPLWRYIEGEICEHYAEHADLIQHWLEEKTDERGYA